MDLYEIRRLAIEHLLNEWAVDGWEVDHVRGEICVGDSWFPVESLPRILSNHMGAVRDAEREANALLARLFARPTVPGTNQPDPRQEQP